MLVSVTKNEQDICRRTSLWRHVTAGVDDNFLEKVRELEIGDEDDEVKIA